MRHLKKLNFKLRKFLRIPTVKDKETRSKFVIGGGIFNEVYKEKVYDFFGFDKKWTVVDVGAHVGFFTIKASKLCKKVVAIEPEISNFEVLLNHIKLNNAKNIIPLNVAAWNENKIKKFYISEYHGTHSLIFGGKKYRYVPCYTLSTILDSLNIDMVDLVKVDVEGAEVEVIKSISPERVKRWIISAEHHKPKDELKLVVKELKNLDYDVRINKNIVYARREKN
ncbi:MAG: FkbM family methyltransferase [Candidatus Micrarchaeota archaeon]|nr:FkbM family methyltransferase [Candidatus Micrarchaeota archaeon]